MPGFTIRGTMIFAQRSRGWQESYFWQRADNNLAAASTDFELLAQKRAPLLGGQGSIIGRRVSVEYNDATPPVKVRGDAKLIQQPVLFGTTTEDSDFADNALLLRRENVGAGPFGESARHSNLPMRGVWDSIVAVAGGYNGAQPGWATLLNNFRANYLALEAGWIGEQASATANAIASTRDPNTGQQTIQTDGTPFAGLAAGTRVQISLSGVNRPAPSIFNGRWVVEVIDPTQCKTLVSVAADEITVAGVLRYLTPLFFKARTIEAEKIGERKTGAPLLQPRGRQKRRARA